jgi:protein TonB
MALRCLLFSADEGVAEPIRQVLAGLGVEGEYCPDAAAAVEKVSQQNFQIVIIDWDKQPEAAHLLSAARERKAAERPLTLAIVSEEGSVAQALQAGANSILRKPLQGNQVKDTLTTARDLLRAKQESAAAVANAAAAGASASGTLPGGVRPAQAGLHKESPLRVRDLLQSAPGAQFVTESNEFQPSSPNIRMSSSKDLEPVAASVEEKEPVPLSPPDSPLPPSGARGLEWYLKTRAGKLPTAGEHEQNAPAPQRPELLGYETPGPSAPAQPTASNLAEAPVPRPKPPQRIQRERKNEAELFAYMAGETKNSEAAPQAKSRMGKRAILGALVLAGGAILAAPQAPWHSKVRGVWGRGQQAMHGWLNPQLVTPAQAPVTHEDFGRAGDEYKMPVEENIPDATTDPSQIHVLPVVDPTAKKPNSDAQNAEPNPGPPAGQTTVQPDGAAATPNDQPPSSGVQVVPSAPETAQPEGTAPPAVAPVPAVAAPIRSDSPAAVFPSSSSSSSSGSSLRAQPVPPKNQQAHTASAPSNVPTSLRSQIASMTPEASGNKAPEAAMDSIEPVAVSEATERALLTEQPALDYPANAKGQQGTVIVQVLIGRDGTVQDAKFMQGSLAFARAAIEGVKRWKFKPYSMNGRAVSVQTPLTISFKPGQ